MVMELNIRKILLVAGAVWVGSVCAADTSAEATKRWHEWRRSREEFPLAAWSYFHRYAGSKQEYLVYRNAGLNFV